VRRIIEHWRMRPGDALEASRLTLDRHGASQKDPAT
jgi:hypothetical protein